MLTPYDTWALENYAGSLFAMGYFQEASEIANPLHEKNQSDPGLLELAFRSSIRSGFLSRAVTLEERGRLLKWERPEIQAEAEAAANAVRFLDAMSIQESVFARGAQLVAEVAHQRGARVRSAHLSIATDEYEFLSYLLFHIAVALADQLEPTGAIVGGHHEAVIKILTGQRTSPFALSCRRAGYILAGMRTIRHSADYQLGKTFSHGQAEDLIARVPAVRDSITEAFDRRA